MALDCSAYIRPSPGTGPLAFGGLLPVSPALEFCIDGGSAGPADVVGVVNAQLPGLGAAITGALLIQGAVVAQLPDLGVAVSASVARSQAPRCLALRWSLGVPRGTGHRVALARGRVADHAQPMRGERAATAGTAHRVAWMAGAPADRRDVARWSLGRSQGMAAAVRWHRGVPRDARHAVAWSAGQRVQLCAVVAAAAASHADPRPSALRWQRGVVVVDCLPIRWRRGVVADSRMATASPPAGPDERQDRIDPVVWPIEPDAVHAVPIRGRYLVLNVIQVRLLPAAVDVPFLSIDIAADVDSWSRTLRATLIGHDLLALIEAQATPVVTITVNGEPWDFLLEDWVQTEAFGNVAVSVEGRSLSAQLSARYVATRSQVSASLATTQQLALDELPAGWTLGWTADDWPIQAGVFSYHDASRIDAIAALAAGPHATLQSTRTGQGLIVQPRWPVWPWQFDQVAADHQVELHATANVRRRYVPPETANTVYVRGEDGGLLGHVTRDGTAGDRELAMAINPLMTDVVGLRALGGGLLADVYPPPRIAGFTLQLSGPAGDTPLIEIGDLVAVVDRDQDVKGMCTSSAVSVRVASDRSIKVRQTIGMGGGGGSNPYARFLTHIRRAPLLVGTVIVAGTESVTVQLPGGGQMTARGQATVGSIVYIRDRVIEAIAASMPVVEISV